MSKAKRKEKVIVEEHEVDGAVSIWVRRIVVPGGWLVQVAESYVQPSYPNSEWSAPVFVPEVLYEVQSEPVMTFNGKPVVPLGSEG